MSGSYSTIQGYRLKSYSNITMLRLKAVHSRVTGDAADEAYLVNYILEHKITISNQLRNILLLRIYVFMLLRIYNLTK